MKSKAFRLLAVAAFVGGMFGAATPAQASTCVAADPTVDYVLCDTVYNPTMRVVCTVVDKALGSCLA
jgi:hypothetical protein